jgi:hypothetical protein
MTEPKTETKAAITELIEAGVADKATLVLLRATQEILLVLDEIKAKVSRFENVLDWNAQDILNSMDYRMMDLGSYYTGKRRPKVEELQEIQERRTPRGGKRK